MANLLGQTNAVPPTKYNGIQTAEAILGTQLPIVIGQQRVGWKLLWYGDFVANKAKQQGGSGVGKGGSQYVYSASVIGAVCMGPCTNFFGVWDSISRYAVLASTESGTVPPGGGGCPNYVPTLAAQYQEDLGSGFTSSYSTSVNDYGSPGAVTLSGTQTTPLQRMPYPGGPSPCSSLLSMQYTVDPATGTYYFSNADVGRPFVISYSVYRNFHAETELAVVPLTGPYQVAVEYQSSFNSDEGVSYYPSGTALTRVSGTPTTIGTYNPNGGVYQFSALDNGAGISISYEYKDPNVDNNAPSTLNLTFINGTLGQSAWSYMSSKHPAFALGYSEVAYVASAGLYLGYTPVLPQLNFEIQGTYAHGAGIPDANPADAIYGLLTATTYKYNFPASFIHYSLNGMNANGSIPVVYVNGYTNTSAGSSYHVGDVVTIIQSGATSNATATVTAVNGSGGVTGLQITTGGAGYTQATGIKTTGGTGTGLTVDIGYISSVKAQWAANNFFISAILDSDQALIDSFSNWCEAGQALMSWDEGLLKFIPLSDTSAIANGFQYSPPTQPIIDLDDDDFIVDANKDPIEIEQTPWQSRWNRVSVKWSVRSNNYNEDVLQIQDEAGVQQNGLLPEHAQDYQFICTEDAAQFAANMRLQRFSAIYTTYRFTLKSNFAFLSPGDIITVTDGLLNSTGTMFGRTPVRIIKMTDNPDDKGIEIEAEQFPWSVATAELYNRQAQLPSNVGDGPQADPGNTVPFIFEVPNRASTYAGGTIYIFANGSNTNWGGFELWVSFNGTDYNFYGQYTNPGRIGVTVGDFPAAPDPDNTNTLTVNMQQSGATLQSVTAADRDAFVTLSALLSPGSNSTTSTVTPTAVTTIGIPVSSPSGSEGPNSFSTASVGTSSGQAWTNPSGALSNVSYAQVSINNASSNTSYSQVLNLLNPGLNIPLGVGAITSFTVSFTWFVSSVVGTINYLYLSGSLYSGANPTSGVTAGNFQINAHPTSPTLVQTSLLDPRKINQPTPSILNDPTLTMGLYVQMGSSPSASCVVNIQDVQLNVAWSGGQSADSWSNLSDVTTNSSYATCSLTNSLFTLPVLCYNFGANLPFGFVLAGIEVTMDCHSTVSFIEVTGGIYSGGVQVGTTQTLPISNSTSTITFGQVVQLGVKENIPSMWGTTSGVLNIDALNAQGQTGLGFFFYANGTMGDTISVRNVSMTLFGASGNQLELISYENAALSGLNTYALTSIRRGVYGTYPIDHPSASVFARLDQATLTYNVDPTFTGSALYFKFLSFNTYGNQLQSLASVTAYTVTVNGLAPGAYDKTSGRILQGTVNYQLSSVEAVLGAVHGSFGVQNIPTGWALLGPQNVPTGTPQWQQIVTGGGGTASVTNFIALRVTSNVSAAQWDFIEVDTTSGNITVTMPPALSNSDTCIGVKKISSDTNTVIIVGSADPVSVDTIEGQSSVVLTAQYTSLYFGSDGLVANWFIVSGWAGASAYDFNIYIPPIAGLYQPSQELYYSTPVRPFTFPASLTNSHAGCRVAPFGSVSVTILKNGGSVGTVNFASNATAGTFTFASSVSFNGTTDTFSLTAPASTDKFFSGFWVDFYGILSGINAGGSGGGGGGGGGSSPDTIQSVNSSQTLSFGGAYTVIVQATSGAGGITLTLQTAVGVGGQKFTIKKVDSGVGAVTINTTSSQTIDGTTTAYTLVNIYQYVTVESNNANWIIVGAGG